MSTTLILLAPTRGIEPLSFLINSQAPTPCLLSRSKEYYYFILEPNNGIEPISSDYKTDIMTIILIRHILWRP